MDTRRVAIAAVMTAGLLPGAALGWLLWHAHADGPMTIGGTPVVRDYVNLWAAGTLVRDGRIGLLFDQAAYADWLRGVFGSGMSDHAWSYPPHMLLLAVPLSMLPLLPGFAAWTAATLASLVAILRRCGVGLAACAAVALGPAAVENALAGQNGALTAACLVGGLLLAGRHPVAAGALLGLLTLKPHLGILIPLCLLASRNRRTILACAETAAACAAVSALAFGWEAWALHLTDTRAHMTGVLHQPYESMFQTGMPTPFMAARAAGAGIAMSYLVQAPVTLGTLVIAWRAWRRPCPDPAARMALTVALALLATPYAMSYDTVAAAAAVAALAGAGLRGGFLPGEPLVLAAAWLWPGYAFWLAAAGAPPSGPFVLAALAAVAWMRLAPGRRPEVRQQLALEN